MIELFGIVAGVTCAIVFVSFVCGALTEETSKLFPFFRGMFWLSILLLTFEAFAFFIWIAVKLVIMAL